MTVGTESQPLRVAIFGSGPAAFYAAEHLFKQKQFVIEVDMFDRLPTPYGLVRAGVAPDQSGKMRPILYRDALPGIRTDRGDERTRHHRDHQPQRSPHSCRRIAC